jgi:hypothetical protein
MQHLPGTQPPGVLAAASSVGHTPYGLGIGIGPGVPTPQEDKRRHQKREREDDESEERKDPDNVKEGSEKAAEGEDAKADVEPGMDIDEPEDDENAPALRRSNRKPGLSTRRRSPSPTPSSSSSSYTRYRPILPDLELAHTVFADRATKDWCQALASGGGQTVQGPGVNPASAGQVMMGGTGGMQREGEVVADFLYAIRVKGESMWDLGD